MENNEKLPADLQEAMQNYLAARRKHEGMRERKDEYPSRSDWQQAVKKYDGLRRDAHNAAARLAIVYGLSPRVADQEETLRLGREKIKKLLSLP